MQKRKQIRLKEYDYSQNGYYFVTICTNKRQNIFYDSVGAVIGRPNKNAQIVENAIKKICDIYFACSVNKYVVMPNHIHMILVIDKSENIRSIADNIRRPMVAPTISTVINQFKGYVSKQIGYSCWQKSFYEHIIRNENEYQKIYEYIENNPLKWEEDKYYNSI